MMAAPQPRPRHSRRKDARPAEIVSAALALFAERGFAATRLEDVAQAAGISKGTVFLYYPTKEDLFRAVVRQELLPVLDQVEAALAVSAGPSAAMIRGLIERFIHVVESDLGIIPKLVISESGNFPDVARFYADEVVARGMRVLGRIIERGVAAGEFRHVVTEQLVPIVMGPLLLLVLWRHSIGRHASIAFDHRAVLKTHVDMLLRGLAPDRPT